jgi:hypothetical protein
VSTSRIGYSRYIGAVAARYEQDGSKVAAADFGTIQSTASSFV